MANSGAAKVRCVRRPAAAKCYASRYQTGSEGALATVQDAATGLLWQRKPPTNFGPTWDEAKNSCAALGAGWRLPTVKEI